MIFEILTIIYNLINNKFKNLEKKLFRYYLINKYFSFSIKTLDKKPMTMWVNSQTKVKNVKMEIRKRGRGPLVNQQRLMFEGVI